MWVVVSVSSCWWIDVDVVWERSWVSEFHDLFLEMVLTLQPGSCLWIQLEMRHSTFGYP